uniref:ZM domain-containing protein n=1 Tax=Strongyloides papillosus TaxID=174720 RepID=A0A0N5B7I4_STREA
MGNKNSRSQLPPNAKFIQNPGYVNGPGMYYFKPGMVPIPRPTNSPMSPLKVSALHQSMHCLNNPEQTSFNMESNKMASRLSLNELGNNNRQFAGGLNPIPYPPNGKIPPGYFLFQGPPMDVKSYKKLQKAHKKMLKKMSSSGDTIIPYPPGPVLPIMMPGMVPINDMRIKPQGRATSLDNLAQGNVEMHEHHPKSGRLSDKKKTTNKKMYRKSFHYEERSHNGTSSVDYHGGTSSISSTQSNLHTGFISDYQSRNDYGEDSSSGIVCTPESSENNSTSNHNDGKILRREGKSCRSSNNDDIRNGENVSLNTSYEHSQSLNINQQSKNNIVESGVREIPIQRLSHHIYSDTSKDGFNTQSSVSSINFNLSNINHKDNRTSTPYKSKTFIAPSPPQKKTIEEVNNFNDTTSDSLFDGSTFRPSVSSSKERGTNSRSTLSSRSINPSLQTISSTINYSHPRSEISDIDFSWVKDIENRLDKEIVSANRNFMSKPVPNFMGRDIRIENQQDNNSKKHERNIPVKYFGMEENFNKKCNIKNDTDYLVKASQTSPNEEELLSIHSNVKSKAAMFDMEASKNEFLAKKEKEDTEYLLKSKHKPPPSYEEHKAKTQSICNLPYIPKPDYLSPLQHDDKAESYYSKIKSPHIRDIKKLDSQHQKCIRYQQNPNRMPSINGNNSMPTKYMSNIEKMSKIENNNNQHPWRTSLAFST